MDDSAGGREVDDTAGGREVDDSAGVTCLMLCVCLFVCV